MLQVYNQYIFPSHHLNIHSKQLSSSEERGSNFVAKRRNIYSLRGGKNTTDDLCALKQLAPPCKIEFHIHADFEIFTENNLLKSSRGAGGRINHIKYGFKNQRLATCHLSFINAYL